MITERSHITLHSWLSKHGSVATIDQVADLVCQIGLAIASYQISLGIEHGDLHSGNIMLNPSARSFIKLNMRGWDIAHKLGMTIRIIDLGYCKSDLIFGGADVATCMAIDSDRRLRQTRNVLFPSEFHDMACILNELIESFENQRIVSFLTSTWI